MNKQRKSKFDDAERLREKYVRRIRKLACGDAVVVPGYAKIKAYRCPKTGRRAFSVSDVRALANIEPGGNRATRSIEFDLLSIDPKSMISAELERENAR